MIDLVGEYCAAMRRMPLSAAQELHSIHGIPWASITATCPVPTRARFTDKARSLFEPDEDGGAVWVQLATPAETQEMKRTPLHWRVPSGGGRIVRGGGRAPAISGMRRNPETEIDPLPPDLRDRYRIYMQERLPWFGRPPRPPALGSPRASD